MINVENLFGLRESEANVAVVEDINEEVRMEWVDGLDRRGLGVGVAIVLTFQSKAKYNTGADDLVVGMRWNAGVESAGCGFKHIFVLFHEFQKFDSKIVKRELGKGNAAAEIFDVEYFVFQSKKLLVTVVKVVANDVFDFLVIKYVVFKGGGKVHESHAGFNAVLEVDVFVQVVGGPEIDELHGMTGATDPIDATKPLNSTDGIPVDVVIDEVIAVLEILTLADAVSRD